MQDRINELMKLSAFELQKRAVATLIAVIEDENSDEDVKEKAIEGLPEAQQALEASAMYYNDTYNEIYEEVKADIEEELDEIISDTVSSFLDSVVNDCEVGCCTCEDECEECECEGEDCIGTDCPCFAKMCASECGEVEDGTVIVIPIDNEEKQAVFCKPGGCKCTDYCGTCDEQSNDCVKEGCPRKKWHKPENND